MECIAPISLTKKAKKAGNTSQVTATIVQELNLMSREEVSASRLADIGQKL